MNRALKIDRCGDNYGGIRNYFHYEEVHKKMDPLVSFHAIFSFTYFN